MAINRREFLHLSLAAPLLVAAGASGAVKNAKEKPVNQPQPLPADRLDIVDSQYHLKRGDIDATLRAMDALGIRSLLIDEFWGEFGTGHPTHIQPGYPLANGAWRAAWPTAQEASLRYPERFAFLVRIDRHDPQLESVMRTVASTPGALAFRLQPVWTLAEVAAFAAGEWAGFFELAQDVGLPLCLFIPGYAELLAPYARQYPQLTFIVDHCGMGFPGIPHGRPAAEAAKTLRPDYLNTVCQLASLPNVAVKWSHTQNLLGAQTYPYESLRPLLRQMIDAFGKERIMWASDNSVIANHSWADLLYYLRDDPTLTSDEKAWILGGTARRLLNWPAV